jgi:hypothetical protein
LQYEELTVLDMEVDVDWMKPFLHWLDTLIVLSPVKLVMNVMFMLRWAWLV